MTKIDTMTAPQLARELGMDPKKLRRKMRAWGLGFGTMMVDGRYVLSAPVVAELKRRLQPGATNTRVSIVDAMADHDAEKTKRRTRRAKTGAKRAAKK